jgi:hypothetical protein
MDGVRNGKVKQTPVNFGYYFKINVKPTKFHNFIIKSGKNRINRKLYSSGQHFQFPFPKKNYLNRSSRSQVMRVPTTSISFLFI